jgi:hypothetical protein
MKLETNPTLIDKLANMFGKTPQAMTIYKSDNLRDFTQFTDSKTFQKKDDLILTIILNSQIKIRFLENTNRSYWYNELTQNKNQANKICENYLKSGFNLVETIDTSINKPVDLYFHKALMFDESNFNLPELIILNPIIGFHMLNNHAYGTIYEAKIK